MIVKNEGKILSQIRKKSQNRFSHSIKKSDSMTVIIRETRERIKTSFEADKKRKKVIRRAS